MNFQKNWKMLTSFSAEGVSITILPLCQGGLALNFYRSYNASWFNPSTLGGR